MFNLAGTIVYVGCLAAIQTVISLSRNSKSGAGIKPPRSVLVSQVPSVVNQLKANQKNPFWAHAVFIFCPAGERHSKKTEVNLGYFVENGKLVLEWSRFTRRNLDDKDKVVAFIKERGQTVLPEDSRVRFFRVEGESIIQLGMQILQDFYHLAGNSKISMYTTEFDWQE
jgi:hypothetical protein